MDFRAEDYYRAGAERMKQARKVYYGGESYALAMYCAGLAVECILRAFRWDRDKSFDGRHVLKELLKASGLLRINEEEMRRKNVSEDQILDFDLTLRAAVNTVIILWHNNLRFASEKRLQTFLHQIDRLQGVKGDPLKKNAIEMSNAAQTVVDRGVALWTSRRK